MTIQQLETFLHAQIPLAKALGVEVLQADDQRAIVKAPLQPNRNHMGTAFGGSLAALLILSGYTWLYQLMATRRHRVHVILQKTETDYVLPVANDFSACATAPDNETVERFLKTFESKGRARISIHAEIENVEGKPACLLRGDFIAQRSDESQLG